MPHAFLLKNGVTRHAAPRPYVRPWADDDDDDEVGRCHGDDGVRPTDVTTHTRQPFDIVTSNLINSPPVVSTASAAIGKIIFIHQNSRNT